MNFRTRPFALTSILAAAIATVAACSPPDTDELTFSAQPSDGKFDLLEGRDITIRPKGEQNFTDTVVDPDASTTDVILAAEDKIVLSGTIWNFNALEARGDTHCTVDEECMGNTVCWEQSFCREIQYHDSSLIQISVETHPDRPVPFGYAISASYDPAGTYMPVACPNGNIFQNLAIDFYAEEVTVNGQTTYSFEECGLTIPRARFAYDNLLFSAMAIPMPLDDDYSGSFKYDFYASSK